MPAEQAETFPRDEERFRLDASALPDCIIPEYLSPTDLTTFVERAIGHMQLRDNYRRIEHTNRAPEFAFAGLVATEGLLALTAALELFAPITTDESWYSVIDDLAAKATGQGINFATELNFFN